MDMVRHEAVRVHRALRFRGELSKQVQVHQIIAVLPEATLAVIAPLHYMQRDVGNDEAREPGHNRTTAVGGRS